MQKLWQMSGTMAFWLSYPALLLYLRFGWRTRIVVMVDDEVLLVKGWLGSGQWQLPGGGVHSRELPAVAACRELKEEVGVTVTPDTLKLLYQDEVRQTGLRYKYYCYALKLKHKPAVRRRGFEITNIAWLPLTSVAKKDLTPETYRALQTWIR